MGRSTRFPITRLIMHCCVSHKFFFEHQIYKKISPKLCLVKLFIWVGTKTLNDKKSEWPKSRNSKLSKFKCRKAIIKNDFKVLNKNLRTQRCRKKFKSKANIRMFEITKGGITN